MKFTRRNDAQRAAEYLADAAAEASFYQEAASELADGKRLEGVWIQALAENEMDEAKAAGAYIQKRVEILKAELYLEAARGEEAREAAREAAEEARETAEAKRLSGMTDAERYEEQIAKRKERIANRKEQMAKNFAD